MNTTDSIFRLLILGAPAVFAAVLHMVAVKQNWVAWLKVPLDLGRTYKGKRIFGNNKTLRGIILMIGFSVIFCFLLELLIFWNPWLEPFNPFHFHKISPVGYGFLIGLGYTLPELPNSFMKRQQDVPPGKGGNLINHLIDQIDSVLGCLLVLYPFTDISFSLVWMGTLMYLGIHLLVNFTLFSLGIRENPT